MKKFHLGKTGILTLVVVILIVVVAFFFSQDAKHRKLVNEKSETILRNVVQSAIARETETRSVLSFFEEYEDVNRMDIRKRRYWSDMLSYSDYYGLQLSMWDKSDKCGEWYSTFTGETFAVVPYNCLNPTHFQEMLTSAFIINEPPQKVVIYLDPYVLYTNYINQYTTSTDEKLTYAQEIRECIFEWALEYAETEFVLNFPVYDLGFWKSLPDAKRDEILKYWDEFIRYGSWYNNITMHLVGAQEWAVVNPYSFDEDGNMLEDVEAKVFAYENTARYTVSDLNVDEYIERFNTMFMKADAGEYYAGNLSDYNLVFFGDSILAIFEQESLNIPGQIRGYTDANIFNIAYSGTNGAYTFPKVAEQIKNGTIEDEEDTSSYKAAHRLFAEGTDNTVFVIEYGFNDYQGGTAVDLYREGLKTGIASLREKYPDAVFVMLSPLFCTYGNNGNDVISETGGPISDYITALEELAESDEKIYFIDIFNSSGINNDNADTLLRDGVHPSYEGALLVAGLVSRNLTKILK